MANMLSFQFPDKSSPLGLIHGHLTNSQRNTGAAANCGQASENQGLGQFCSPAPTSGTSQRKTEIISHTITQFGKDLRAAGISDISVADQCARARRASNAFW